MVLQQVAGALLHRPLSSRDAFHGGLQLIEVAREVEEVGDIQCINHPDFNRGEGMKGYYHPREIATRLV